MVRSGERRSGARRWAARVALGAAVASATLAFSADEAAAQTPTAAQREDAKRRFQSGLDLFKEGNYQASLVEFKRAYEIAPNYNVLYNIGQVYFQLQDYVNASKYLNQYLDEGRQRITQTRRTEVEADLEKLKGRIAQVMVVVNVSGAQIYVDDQPIGTSPLREPLMVSAGRRVFSASREGRQTVRKTVEVAGGDRLEVQVELPELAPGQAPSPPIVPPPPDGDGQVEPPPPDTGQPQPAASKPFPTAPVIAWSVTGALGIGAAVFGVVALGNDDELATLKQEGDPDRDELSSAASSTTTMAAISDVFLVASIIGAGVSIYLTVDYASSDPPAAAEGTGTRRAPSPTVAAKVGPGSVGLGGTF
jgi:hypothetical protein